jgi:hypothetical protein
LCRTRNDGVFELRSSKSQSRRRGMRVDSGSNVFPLRRSSGCPNLAGAGFRACEGHVRKRRKREKQVLEIIRARAARREFLDFDLFHEPAWDMLLALYAAELGGGAMTVGGLCEASAGPFGVGLRHIRFLVRKGLFVVQGQDDDRNAYVCLSDSSLDAMDKYFDHLNADEFPDVIAPAKLS